MKWKTGPLLLMSSDPSISQGSLVKALTIHLADRRLQADLTVPEGSRGLVIFVHGSGSSRESPRNRAVASALNQSGLSTFLFDLLTHDEEQEDARKGHLRFDIHFLSKRLEEVVQWLIKAREAIDLPLGLFGASTGAAAALMTAASLGDLIHAVVSRGGRPDLAFHFLENVRSPTLLLVGEQDEFVLTLNQKALNQIHCVCKLEIIAGASHLFPEPGALEKVSESASKWFLKHFPGPGS